MYIYGGIYAVKHYSQIAFIKDRFLCTNITYVFKLACIIIIIHFMCVFCFNFDLLFRQKQAEGHLLLVTQERSMYRETLDRSRRQAQVHFFLEGKFVQPNITSRIIILSILYNRCIIPAICCSPIQSTS